MKKILILAAILIIAAPAYSRDIFLKVRDTQTPAAGQVKTVEKPPVDSNYLMQTFALNYLNAEEIKDTIAGVTAPGEGVMSSEKTNTIIVRASQKTINRIKELLSLMDKAPKQVNVEAKIIEIKTGNGDNSNPSVFGMSWQYYNAPGSSNMVQFFSRQEPTADATAIGMYGQLVKGNLSAYLSMLEKKSGYDLIASPSITAINHEPAEILIGQKLAYNTLLNTTTGTLQQVNFVEVGTKLKFVPHIASDGNIKMDIYPSISEGVIIDGLPNENATETKSSVLVRDGQTIVIGGLTKTYKNAVEIAVPIVSQIPFLGSFFRRKELRTEKRDIVVLITPHIVNQEYIKQLNDKVDELQKEDRKNDPNRGKLIY